MFGAHGGIRTHTVRILSPLPAASWATCALVYMFDGARDRIRTYTVLILNQSPPTSWATRAKNGLPHQPILLIRLPSNTFQWCFQH